MQAAEHDTLTADNGARVVELARSAKPSLILTDAHMFVLDGVSAVKLLKANEDTKAILTIAITAFGSYDHALAQQVLARKLAVRLLEQRSRQAHIERLHQGYQEAMATSDIHLDILANLKQINSHVMAIAYAILDR